MPEPELTKPFVKNTLPSAMQDEEPDFETKPFLAHLEDLRWMLFRSAGALAVAVVICAFTTPFILKLLYVPYVATGHDVKSLINIGVVDPFSIHMEISLFGGLIFSLPAILYFIGQFLLPALTPKEKRFLGPIFAGGTVLFIIGVGFCYGFVLRAAIEFFEGYSSYLGMETMWTAKGLIDFEVQMLLGFGLAFEFPMVLLVLNLFGILSSEQLASKRRHAGLAIFVAACCIIPSTDPFSLSLLTLPLYALYEACIWVARLLERRKARALMS